MMIPSLCSTKMYISRKYYTLDNNLHHSDKKGKKSQPHTGGQRILDKCIVVNVPSDQRLANCSCFSDLVQGLQSWSLFVCWLFNVPVTG